MLTTTGTNKDGKAWKKYVVTFDDGRKGATFSATLGAMAARFYESGEMVTRTLVDNANPKFLPDLTALALKEGNGTPPEDDPFGRFEDVHA